MAIHHTQQRKAEKLGLQLQEGQGSVVQAFWPARNQIAYGVSAQEAIAQAQAIQIIFTQAENMAHVVKILHHPQEKRLVHVIIDDKVFNMEAKTPHDMLGELRTGESADGDVNELIERYRPENQDIDVEEAVNNAVGLTDGVPTDGGVAHKQGIMTPDCPFDDGTPEAEQWLEEWEASADEADAAAGDEEEAKKSGTVVAEKYRIKYRELGHPENCGDWLNGQLDARIKNKQGTNLELLDLIMDANGVKNTAKLEKPSDRGRYRMTGRVILARRIFLEGGKFIIPEQMGGEVLQAPADWMAAQKFKPKKEA